MLLLDDDHLDSLRCSRCHKYLSLFPVKNHPKSRDVTCGRCSRDDDGAVRSFLYELVAVEYLFRCVNRYEGCGEMLRVDETGAHEQRCVGRTFPCPKCEDGVEKPALELQWHYRSEHPSSYLRKTNRFEAIPRTDDVKLYVRDDVFAFVSVWYRPDALRLSSATLRKACATQAFSVSRGERLWERTERRRCLTVGAYDGDPHVLYIDPPASVEVTYELEPPGGDPVRRATAGVGMSGIRLVAELGHKLGYRLNDRGTALISRIGRELNLTCSNCKLLIGMPAYKCKKSKHQICYDCRSWCGVCDTLVVLSGPGDLLYEIGSHLEFPCRWNCGEFFTKDLRTHENSCPSKMFKCPMCSFEIESSHVTYIKIHLLDDHEISNFCGDYDCVRIRSIIGQKSNGALSFVTHGKCCYLKWCVFNSRYDLNFGLYGNEQNVQLAMVYSGSKYLNVLPQLHYNFLDKCIPYIDFNSMKQ